MCVYIKAQGTEAILSRGKSITHSGVAQQTSQSFARTNVSTRGLIHTLGHAAPYGLTACEHRPFSSDGLGPEGSRLSGRFQTLARETDTTFLIESKLENSDQTSLCSPPPRPHPHHILNRTSSSDNVPSGDVSRPTVRWQRSLLEGDTGSRGGRVHPPGGRGWRCLGRTLRDA